MWCQRLNFDLFSSIYFADRHQLRSILVCSIDVFYCIHFDFAFYSFRNEMVGWMFSAMLKLNKLVLQVRCLQSNPSSILRIEQQVSEAFVCVCWHWWMPWDDSAHKVHAHFSFLQRRWKGGWDVWRWWRTSAWPSMAPFLNTLHYTYHFKKDVFGINTILLFRVVLRPAGLLTHVDVVYTIPLMIFSPSTYHSSTLWNTKYGTDDFIRFGICLRRRWEGDRKVGGTGAMEDLICN